MFQLHSLQSQITPGPHLNNPEGLNNQTFEGKKYI